MTVPQAAALDAQLRKAQLAEDQRVGKGDIE